MKTTSIKILVIGCLALTAATFSACRFNCKKGSGNMKSVDRKISDFSEIKVSGAYKLVLKQDSSSSLKITADDNLLDYIRTDVSGNRLTISSKRNLCTKGQIVINVGLKNLTDINGSGAIELVSDGKLNLKDISIDLTGASKADLDLNAANVRTKGSGATEIKLKGQATSHNVDFSGAGKLFAYDFVVGSYDIESTGAGHCQINVLNNLDVHTTGASEIEYKGNPSSINKTKTGASTITKVD